MNGTFGGNGRTCATCHRLDAETTIDRDFIALLPSTDPLFVSEFNLDLPPFDEGNPLKPALEFPFIMHTKGLILENIDGTEVDENGNLLRPPVFRMTPGLFNLSFTAPYGDSACCLDLQIFSAVAVFQHFPKTLNRVAGLDFLTPTTAQLQALEAFQLSLSSPTNGNFKISGRGSLLSIKSDPLAADTTRSEVRGRNFFLATNSCVTCHRDTVFSGGNLNLNTGVEAFGTLRSQTPTVDDGDGFGRFQVPPLFGLRKTHFFHNGILGNNLISPPPAEPSCLRTCVRPWTSTGARSFARVQRARKSLQTARLGSRRSSIWRHASRRRHNIPRNYQQELAECRPGAVRT